MKKLISASLLCLASLATFAQDFPFAKPVPEEFELKKYDKDTSAHAVVLKEFGTAYISSSTYNLIFDYHVRIKIFDSKGFKEGNISIPVRKNDANTFETIRNIKGITFYADEQGLIRSSPLDPKQIFKEKSVSKYHDLTKFALPNLKNGCIIEYSYQIESPFIFNFRSWEFQSDIPKIYTEFVPRIPACYNYNVSLKGPYALSKNSGELEKECFTPGGGFKADCSKMTYAMENVPAFKEEDYMTARSNFLATLSFELSEYTNAKGAKIKVTKEWRDIDLELKTHESFGLQLKKKDFFKDQLTAITFPHTDALTKAKAIYQHFQSWFKWNNYNGKYSDLGVKKAYEGHTGNVGDINLSLVTAMNSAGLDAEAVILSTRSNGLINNIYPVLSDFDYVICKLNIGESSYLLDATDPLLPFGLLPLKCINDKGRVISLNKPSYWIDLKASQKESKNISLALNIDTSGKAKGTILIYSRGYEAYNKRRKIKKFNSLEEYVEDLDERMPKIKLNKSEITNLDSLEETLQERYEVEMNLSDLQEKGKLTLNPFFMERVTENPFKLNERTYPVDLGAPSESRIVMQISFPDGHQLESQPQNIGLALPNNGGKFVSNFTAEANSIAFTVYTQFNKSIYSSEEYLFLKELYNKIIQSQQTNIVLKKKI